MFKKRDLILDFFLIIITVVGLFSLFSISNYYFTYQLYFALFSLFIYFLIPIVSFKNYKLIFPVFYVIILSALIYLFLFGQVARGSASWINLGPINFQPSEFAKILVIFYTSVVLGSLFSLKKTFLMLLTLFLPVVTLILIQPDFGTFALILLLFIAYLFLKINSIKSIVISLVFLVFFSAISYTFLQDYQKNRITSFLNPSSDALGSGYNVIQSQIAIGSGGLFGKGFKQNTQVTLNFLPEPQTDFIFAATSESFGFFYSLLLIFLTYGICIWVYKNYFLKIEDNLTYMYFSYGVFVLILVQATLNIGMNLGLLPVTGLPLPFISYGGSSLLTFFILFGFLQLIYKENRSI